MPDATTSLARLEILETVARLQQEDLSQNAACRALGVSSASVTRWRRAYAAGGLAALEPGQERSGRKPLVRLDEEEEMAVKQLKVKLESTTAALRMFAESPACRPEVAEAIHKKRSSKHTLTPTLRAQAEVPAAVVNMYKSPRQARFACYVQPRTLEYVDALGVTRQLQPGDLFERDDMSNNFIVWVPWPWGGDPCSDKYGVRIARGQCLEMIDVKSLFFTSFNFVIRLRDSYRADDIWQWIHHTYTHLGMPRIGERWERGTWASKKLRGDREAMIEEGHTPGDVRLGGMAALGLRVIESQSPTTKIIENRFNTLQRIEATIKGQIGRSRGEFEHTTKLWTACRLGHRDPREYFLSYEEATAEIEKAHQYVNWEPVEGSTYGRIVPAVEWQRGTEAAPLARLPAEKGFLFARCKREITCRKSQVIVRYQRDGGGAAAWHFYHRDLWQHDGEKCAVYFDDYAPCEGATLVLLSGRQAGTVIPGAELIQGCPQFSLEGGQGGSLVTDRGGIERGKAQMGAVISTMHTLGLSSRLSRGRIADDGQGGRSEMKESKTSAGGDAGRASEEAPAGRIAMPHRGPSAPRRAEILSEEEEQERYERTMRRIAADQERESFLPV